MAAPPGGPAHGPGVYLGALWLLPDMQVDLCSLSNLSELLPWFTGTVGATEHVRASVPGTVQA